MANSLVSTGPAKPKPRKRKAAKKAHDADGHFAVDDPSTEMVNEAFDVVISAGTTSGYRDGKDCVEMADFPFGVPLPKGWKDTPSGLDNYTTNKDTNFKKVK